MPTEVDLLAVLRALLGVEGRDALGGKLERGAQLGGEALPGGEAVGAVDPPAGRIEVVAVEQARQVAHRAVAFVADALDDVGDVARDILVGLAPRGDQRGEGGGEVGGSGVEADQIPLPLAGGVRGGDISSPAIAPPPTPPASGRGVTALRNASTSGTASRARLERRAVDDQPRGDLRDHLHLDQPVLLERAPRRDEVDDPRRQPQHRRQLHRAVELDAFGLHAARLEMAAGGVRIFGGDADVAPAARIVLRRQVGGLGDRQAAMADAQVDRA